jgi:hypothetical protein
MDTQPNTPAGHDIDRSAERRKESIEVAAYYMAERRGFSPGGELGDWLRAEIDMDRLAFEDKLDRELKEWDTTLGRLIDGAQSARKELRTELQVQIATLAKRRTEFRARMDEIHQQGKLAWGDVKAGLEGAWKDLRTSLDKSASRFK